MSDEKRIIQYYLLRSGLSSSLYGKVRYNQPYTEKDFIEMMCKDEPELDANMVKKVMRAMTLTGVRALRSGMPLVIKDFIKIYPSIKGGFSGNNDFFDRSRHTLHFKATLAKGYIDKVVDGLSIEKIERPKKLAEIDEIENVRTGNNELTKHFTNKLTGNYFLIPGYKLLGVELANANNLDDMVMIEVENLDIPGHSMKEFSFSIAYNYDLPIWLAEGSQIYITLIYIDDDTADELEKKPMPGFTYLTKWKEL